MLQKILKANMSHVLGSAKASATCSRLNVLFSMPAWLARRRSTVMAFSRSVTNLARAGLSGRKTPSTTDHASDTDPKMMKYQRHWLPPEMAPTLFCGLLGEFCGTCL